MDSSTYMTNIKGHPKKKDEATSRLLELKFENLHNLPFPTLPFPFFGHPVYLTNSVYRNALDPFLDVGLKIGVNIGRIERRLGVMWMLIGRISQY